MSPPVTSHLDVIEKDHNVYFFNRFCVAEGSFNLKAPCFSLSLYIVLT